MELRPKLKIEYTNYDRAIEGLCIVILLALWTGTIAGFSKLPEQIPTHFNLAGRADDYSSKRNIFILPLIATIIYMGMTIINRYPHLYNYPGAVRPANAMRLYTSATKLIRTLKLAVVVIFSAIVFLTYKSAFNAGDGLGTWFLPAVLALLFVPVLLYLISGPSQQVRMNK